MGLFKIPSPNSIKTKKFSIIIYIALESRGLNSKGALRRAVNKALELFT